MTRDGQLPCGCYEGEECTSCAPWSVEEVRAAMEFAYVADREARDHLEASA